MAYSWDFGVIWEYRHPLLSGFGVSLLLSGAAVVTGILSAVPLALLMRIACSAVGRPVSALVQVVRGVPLLVSLIFGYYLLPTLLGFKLSPFVVAWVVLSLNFAAFAADVLRGSLRAVPKEYIEAGMAIGMTRSAVFARIVLPETVRRSLPALAALSISLVKYSSLASVISVTELTRAADLIIVEKYKPLELYLAIAVLYLCIVLPLGYGARKLERHPWFGHEAGNSP